VTTLTRHPADTPIDELACAIARDGYVIIEGAAPELTSQAYAALITDVEAAPLGHTAFLGGGTKRLGGLLRRSPAVQQLAIHPLVMALADRILQPHCARYQLNFSGIMHLLPGAEPQVLHRDGDLYPFRFPSPPTLMPTMWALSDFTADNGATQIVPGSHRWEEDREPFADEIVAAAMPAGSVLIYESGTLHGGGPNRSAITRTGLALQYSLGWLRQEENQYLTNPPEVARAFPERLQRLIGYDYGGPYLGFVDGDTAQRLLVDGYDGPKQRSNDEVDALAARMERLRWGHVEPVATPAREGSTVPTLKSLGDA
jgi:ectoine hydroxylase-related dioxygenase (phytanoyl-CoA dioxygenase family)